MSSTKKIYLTSIALGLAALILIGFVIYPLFKETKKHSKDLIFQKRTLVELRARTENLKNLQALYETCQSSLEKIDTLLIDSEVPIDFIKFLEKEAYDSQLFIKISPSALKEAEGDPWPSMNFQLTLTGAFPDFSKFLEKLEASSYLMKTLTLNVRRLTERDLKTKEFEGFSVGDVSAALLIKVFAK